MKHVLMIIALSLLVTACGVKNDLVKPNGKAPTKDESDPSNTSVASWSSAAMTTRFVIPQNSVNGPTHICATGALLTSETVMLTVAGAESTCPSFTVNVKLSGPEKPALGE